MNLKDFRKFMQYYKDIGITPTVGDLQDFKKALQILRG
jgi:hypothetical protein